MNITRRIDDIWQDSAADRYWNTPFMDKWGRLILLFLSSVPFFFWFSSHAETSTTNDQFVLVSIIFALAVGMVISTATTEKYYARSLGLYGIITGALVYYTYLLMRYRDIAAPTEMLDFTRAIFLVGSWLFAIASLYTWYQKRKTP